MYGRMSTRAGESWEGFLSATRVGYKVVRLATILRSI
jgi:hypothetical protein